MDANDAKASDVGIAQKGQIRKGKNQMDTASKAARDYALDLFHKGYAKSAIRRLLSRDYGINIDSKGFATWIEKQSQDKFQPGTESFKEGASKEFANVFDGLLDAQRAIRDKFNQAIQDDDAEKIAIYAKLINENVKTAHDIFMDINKTEKNVPSVPQVSFGQMLESMSKKRSEALVIPGR